MKTTRMVACVTTLALGLAIVGCEKSDTETTGGTAATPAASPSAATPSQTAATPAATPAAPAGTATDTAAAETAAKTETPTTAPAGAAAAATSAEVTQAQTLLDQTVTYIKENKMDLAEKSLTQLEALKPKLPVEYHSKIDGARKAFNAAKTGQGLKLDSVLPGAAK